ncbi:MAG: excisionase family DNA-binding protein [Candidatus Zixiibacteriota bacterium]|nr:MAG: excisionase family DNA-binding protein [candidate division Zixibacteria bacterium]
MIDKKYITIPRLAELLGVSRIAIYKRVRSGEIPAKKVGRTYIITDETVNKILGKKLTQQRKKRIEDAVKKTVREYGEVLKKLGRE